MTFLTDESPNSTNDQVLQYEFIKEITSKGLRCSFPYHIWNRAYQTDAFGKLGILACHRRLVKSAKQMGQTTANKLAWEDLSRSQ